MNPLAGISKMLGGGTGQAALRAEQLGQGITRTVANRISDIAESLHPKKGLQLATRALTSQLYSELPELGTAASALGGTFSDIMKKSEPEKEKTKKAKPKKQSSGKETKTFQRQIANSQSQNVPDVSILLPVLMRIEHGIESLKYENNMNLREVIAEQKTLIDITSNVWGATQRQVDLTREMHHNELRSHTKTRFKQQIARNRPEISGMANNLFSQKNAVPHGIMPFQSGAEQSGGGIGAMLGNVALLGAGAVAATSPLARGVAGLAGKAVASPFKAVPKAASVAGKAAGAAGKKILPKAMAMGAGALAAPLAPVLAGTATAFTADQLLFGGGIQSGIGTAIKDRSISSGLETFHQKNDSAIEGRQKIFDGIKSFFGKKKQDDDDGERLTKIPDDLPNIDSPKYAETDMSDLFAKLKSKNAYNDINLILPENKNLTLAANMVKGQSKLDKFDITTKAAQVESRSNQTSDDSSGSIFAPTNVVNNTSFMHESIKTRNPNGLVIFRSGLVSNN